MPDKPKTKIIKTTIRIDRNLWNKVRILAVKNGTTAEALVTLALQELVSLTLEELLKLSKRGK